MVIPAGKSHRLVPLFRQADYTDMWIIGLLSDKAPPGPKPCAAVAQLVTYKWTADKWAADKWAVTVCHEHAKLIRAERA